MFLKNCLRTFTGNQIRFLLNKNSIVPKYINYKSSASLSTTKLALDDQKVKVTFVLNDGRRLESEAKVGDSLLDVVVNNELNIEGLWRL
uniref:Adrenodoxin, mitochondrial n=1 Tax=Papilio xuthus TaxID=66420 RepID=I4DKI4_PAPXU|nr:unknown unsecreted protein [Papilio xuthus]